nr:MAG TPA: Cell wall hydrolase autolysin [Caudoviricetes sp.]
MRICIDCGHQLRGADTGASGYIIEQQESRKIAPYLKEYLEKEGHTVRLTNIDGGYPNVNSSLQARVNVSNNFRADFFISLHFNAGGGQGTETWIYSRGGQAEQYAKRINSKLVGLGLRNRGVKVGNLYVIRKTNCPAVLCEIGFVDSKVDTDFVVAHRKEVAKAIAEGILNKSLGTIAHEPVAEPKPVETKKPVCGNLQGYNATVKNDFFYTRDINGNKDGGRVDIGDQIKILSLVNNKQLLYVEYPVSGGTKKAYITNDCSCISFRYEGQWKNGSTPEKVFSDSSLRNEIGSLDPRESATPLFSENGKLYLIYDTSKGTKTKAGFVEYLAGFNF